MCRVIQAMTRLHSNVNDPKIATSSSRRRARAGAMPVGPKYSLFMRPVDGSISINRPDVPDNKRVHPGKLLAPDAMGKAAHYLCLDDSSLHENVSRIREARAAKKPCQIESALIKLLPLPAMESESEGR